MREIADFEIKGFQPAPWSVPDICVTRAGHRFTKRRGRSNLAEGICNLLDWQKLVSDAARSAMSGQNPVLGPVRVEATFYIRAPEGKPKGAFCFLPMKWNNKSLEYTKTPLKGRTLPDLTNLVKGSEDALQSQHAVAAMRGMVFHDDWQVVEVVAQRKWGEHGGCRIRVWLLEETYEKEAEESASHHEQKPSDERSVRAKRASKSRRRSHEPVSG